MPFQQTEYQKKLCVRKLLGYARASYLAALMLHDIRAKFLENSTTESVQLFNVKAKFQVKTFTALNKLEVEDDCNCDV